MRVSGILSCTQAARFEISDLVMERKMHPVILEEKRLAFLA